MQLNYNTINYTDLDFLNYCKCIFNVNRGVYNAIDLWFYNQGEKDIFRRRRMIIKFLEYSRKTGDTKFGKGNLKIKLKEFSNVNGV